MSRLRAPLTLLFSRSIHSNFIRPKKVGKVPRNYWLRFGSTIAFGAICFCGYYFSREDASAKEECARFVLYQYSNCPFCSKVRAYLHHSGEDFQIVEVNPITKAELKAVTNYRKVPTLIADGIKLYESSVITSVLETHHTTGRPISEVVELYPAQVQYDESLDHGKIRTLLPASVREWWYGKERPHNTSYPNKYHIMESDETLHEEAMRVKKWRKWIDDHFVHMISPNVYRTWAESLVAFDYFTNNGNFTDFQKTYIRYIGAFAMYQIGKKLKRRHNLGYDVRLDMYGALNRWIKGLEGKPFNGGDTPNLADIEMWGMCSAFHGMPTWEDACQHTKIEAWYGRMEEHLGGRSAVGVVPANPTLVQGGATNMLLPTPTV